MKSNLMAAAISGVVLGMTGLAQAGASHDEKPSLRAATGAMPLDAKPGDKHACKGKNECKGKGGCKSEKHACKGQNACKGQGGCKG